CVGCTTKACVSKPAAETPRIDRRRRQGVPERSRARSAGCWGLSSRSDGAARDCFFRIPVGQGLEPVLGLEAWETLASSGICAGGSPHPCDDQGDSLPSPWTPC